MFILGTSVEWLGERGGDGLPLSKEELCRITDSGKHISISNIVVQNQCITIQMQFCKRKNSRISGIRFFPFTKLLLQNTTQKAISIVFCVNAIRHDSSLMQQVPSIEVVTPQLAILKMADVQGSDCCCLGYLLSDES